MPAVLFLVVLAVLGVELATIIPFSLLLSIKIFLILAIIADFALALLPISMIFGFIYYATFGIPIGFKAVFSYALQIWPKFMRAIFVYIWLVVSGIIFFVIPGVMIFLSNFFSPFLIVTENLSLRQSLKESRHLTEDFLLDIWLVIMSILVVVLFFSAILGFVDSALSLYLVILINVLLIPLWITIFFNLYLDINQCYKSRFPHWLAKPTLLIFCVTSLLIFLFASVFSYTPLSYKMGLKEIPPSSITHIPSPSSQEKTVVIPLTQAPSPQPGAPGSAQAPTGSTTTNSPTTTAPATTTPVDPESLDYKPEYPKSYYQ